MEQREAAYRGCLLGMAVGDAMGYTVDKKSWSEICEDYGPNGLLGYDLVNGTAEITSYTQIAAFVGNAMLLGASRGHTEKLGRYMGLGLREWAKSQQFRGAGEKTFCWLAQVPIMRRRCCMDTRMLDVLNRDILGTPEKPVLRSDTPGAITAAAAVALIYDPSKMELSHALRLGAESVAFTHGDPTAFLAGAGLTSILIGILQNPEKPLSQQFTESAGQLRQQFGEAFPEAEQVARLIEHAIVLSKDPELSPLAAISMLGCTTAAECLAGAVYASMIHPANFDEGMIVAVNHSGRSGAVGALTGAILGAKLGADALPEFYLESLEQVDTLSELAEDLTQSWQVMRVFDDTWDQKYTQGVPSR